MVNKTLENGIILARSICDSCGKNSGPILSLPELRDSTDFLRENVIPTGNEREILLQDIGKAEEKISQLDVEIDRLKQLVTSLRQQRNTLRDSVNREKSLFAPIRKLPDDVLRHLFVTCQRYSRNDGFIRVYYRNETSVETIMNVCTHWRHVARSAPELWSRISIWNDSCPEPKHVAVEQFFDACISFSREIPLSLRILLPLQDCCIRKIARCAYRWKEIDARDGHVFSDVVKYVDPDLVLTYLERLSMDDVSSSISINPSPVLSYFQAAGPDEDDSELVTVSFKSAPSLHKLCLEYVHHPMSAFIDLPWDQITTFESNSNEYDKNELARLLKSMPNLVSFTLEGESNIKETVMLPSLKAFILPNETNIYYPSALDAFTAPQVETLHVESEMDPSSVFHFLTRSCCPLSDLKLAGTYLDKECMETCSSLRTVKTLCLIVPDLQWNDILALTQKDQHTGISSHFAFPQLESLEMRWVVLENDRKFSDVVEPVVHMLKSRIASSGPDGDFTLFSLKQVTIMFTEYLTEEEIAAFVELNRSELVRLSGVKVTIAHKSKYCFVIQNGVAIEEETTDSEETSSSDEENNTDSDDSTNSSEDTNTDSEDMGASGEESYESD